MEDSTVITTALSLTGEGASRYLYGGALPVLEGLRSPAVHLRLYCTGYRIQQYMIVCVVNEYCCPMIRFSIFTRRYER